MTYGHLKKACEYFLKAEKEYKQLAEKHFPITWGNQPIKVTPITREVIQEIATLRKNRDEKEENWHKALIEYSRNRA